MNTLSISYLKQVSFIINKIGLFELNKLDLYDLVCDLIGLLNVLESVPNTWIDGLRSAINTLELIHDSIEDGSISRWKGNFKEDLNKSVSKLKSMSTSMIEEYLKKTDPNIIENAIEASSTWLMCPECNDAWESRSRHAMVICPKCECALHNPRVTKHIF